MPSVSANELIGAILDALAESGCPALLLSSLKEHPRRFLVQTEMGNVGIWLYAWTLTHGGRPTLPDEFRIQLTSVTPPLHLDGGLPNFKTFLNKRIHLPPDQRQWPQIELVRKANRHRRIL